MSFFSPVWSDMAHQGGQGDAVLEQVASRWQTHVDLVLDEQARAHARRLVQRGES